MVMQVNWIADAAALSEHVAQWRTQPFVGFDTEFIRVRTFYPNIALYQVGMNQHCALIDPLAIDTFAEFTAWLTDQSTVLVMHSCSEDLEVMQHHLGVLPATIFDTQVAASFVGRDHGLGYQALVRRELDIELLKGETRSDWLQRPLSPEQRHYAAEDVHYLPLLYERLTSQLRRLGRLEWASQEMRRLREAAAPRRAEDYFRTVRDAWRLDARQLAVFSALCLWREETARQRNRPRGHIVADEVLLDIAKRGLTRRRDLASVLSETVLERSGDVLMQRIEAALNLSDAQLPTRLPGPLNAQQGALLKALRERIMALAAQLDMAETTLASRRLLEAFIRDMHDGEQHLSDGRNLSTARDWRDEIVMPELRAVAARLGGGR